MHRHHFSTQFALGKLPNLPFRDPTTTTVSRVIFVRVTPAELNRLVAEAGIFAPSLNQYARRCLGLTDQAGRPNSPAAILDHLRQHFSTTPTNPSNVYQTTPESSDCRSGGCGFESRRPR